MIKYTDYLESPLGCIEITATIDAITSVSFVNEPRAKQASALTEDAKQQLNEYFLSERQNFDLALAFNGTTFQENVWLALGSIPYGITCSYLDIAKQIKKPKAVRAVGAANGKNPLGIVVPCHRVIGSSGSLIGYAAGTERKAWLLAHEQKYFKK